MRRFRPSIRDLKAMALLLVLFPSAWLVPERHWGQFCRALRTATGPRARHGEEIFANYIGQVLSGIEQHRAQEIARRYLANLTEMYLQYFREYRPDGWSPRIEVLGQEHVEAARAQGQPVILWSPYQLFVGLVLKKGLHQAGLSVHHLSMPGHGFSSYSRFGKRYLNPIITRMEDRYLAERISYDPTRPMRSVLRLDELLRDGRIVSITATIWAQRFVPVSILEGAMELPLTSGPVRLAWRHDAVLLPCLVERRHDKGFVIRIEPPLDIHASEDQTAALMAALNQYGEYVSRFIVEHTDLWRFRIPTDTREKV